jgi:hypothetical protein
MKKNEYMAIIIRDYLSSLGKGTHTLTALDARKLSGMDDYAANSCYPNVCIAMDKVAKESSYRFSANKIMPIWHDLFVQLTNV